MEDPVLNRNLEETKELQQRWSQFHDFVLMAVKQGQKITPQAEMKFLELKSRIAMLHDGFMGSLKHDIKTGQNIMQIVSDCILLKRVANSSDAEKQKFEFDWNEGFMLLTEQVGSLEEEKKRLAGINERAYRAQQAREVWQARIHNFLHSNGLKWSLILIVVVFVLWGVPATGLYDYRRIPVDVPALKTPYKIFTNKVYRPYLGSNLVYGNFDLMPIDPEAIKNVPGSITTADASQLTKDYFKKQVLPRQLGLRQPELKDVQALLDQSDGTKPPVVFTDFQSERFSAESQDAQFYWIIVDSSADAQKIVDLINQGVNKSPQAQAIKGQVFLCRSANFLGFGISNHAHKSGWVASKFKFKENATNQLR